MVYCFIVDLNCRSDQIMRVKRVLAKSVDGDSFTLTELCNLPLPFDCIVYSLHLDVVDGFIDFNYMSDCI